MSKIQGYFVGLFGREQEAKNSFASSVAKKSETEGMSIYFRSESGTKYSFLDDATFPEKIQGYSRIAALSDYAYYLFPRDGKLNASDGELAVLLDSFSLKGSVELVDSPKDAYGDLIRTTFKDVGLSSFPLEERGSKSSVLSLSLIQQNDCWPKSSTLVFVDRAFNVKGVGLVVLGFLLSGSISLHDRLRILPCSTTKFAEVRGIQVNDEDQENVGRGIRVGLSLKGVELKDLDRVSWMDDGSLVLSKNLHIRFNKSKFYKQSFTNREIHVQCNGGLLLGKFPDSELRAETATIEMSQEIPIWEGMKIGCIDLNARPLRVIGGGRVSMNLGT